MKRILSLALCVGMVSAASAAPIINTDFTAAQGYAAGDITLNAAWGAMPNTGSPTLSVDPTGSGYADSTPYYSTTNYHDYEEGNFLYISPSNGVGNAVDDEISGIVDFKLSTGVATGTNIFLNPNLITPLAMGLSAAATNRIGGAAPILLLDVLQNTGDFRVRFSGGTDHAGVSNNRELFRLSAADIGWDPASTNVPDYDSQNLRLEWTFRKTRTPGYYSASATITNLDGTAFASSADTTFDTFAMKTNTYDAANTTFAIGRHSNNLKAGVVQSTINVAIDALSVDETSGNAPVLEPATLSASGGNEVVDLSWSTVMDATSYELYRSTDSNTVVSAPNLVVTTNGTAYADTGLANDIIYYYIVRAKSSGVADADSNIASAEPQAAATGLIVDTDFSATDTPAYADGNIDGQNRWKDATAGTSPVFAITDAAGSGFANSEPYTNNFDNTLANDIYYNRLMSNNVGDEFTGSITFQVKAPATAGQEVIRTIDIVDTNDVVVGSYTGTNDVAGMSGGELFKIGLTADPDSGLDKSDLNDIFFYVKCQLSGRLDINFNSTANTDRIMQLGSSTVGWDPNWLNTDNTATNGPDSETDPITFNWKIRKTTVADTYLAYVDIIINGVTNNASWEVLPQPVLYAASTDAYAADFMYLGMGIGADADQGKTDQGSGTVITTAVKSVSIDAVSLTKADNQPPLLVVPGNILTDVADGTANMEWDVSVESSGYIVRNYSAYSGGSATILTNGLIELTYTDTGLNNGQSYFYTIAADYDPYGEAESEMIVIRPLGKVTVMQWGPSEDTVTASISWSADTATVGGIVNHVGKVGAPGGPMWDAGVGTYETNVVPPLYGVSQLGDGAWAQTQVRDDTPDLIRVRTKSATGSVTDSGYHSTLIWVESSAFTGGASIDLSDPGYSIETSNTDWTDSDLGFGSLRSAVRSIGGQWYVGKTIHADTGDTLIDLNTEKWTTLTAATLASTSMMTVTGQSYTVESSSIGLVDAVGFFADHIKSHYMASWKVSAGEQATQFQLYMDGFNIYNEDAAGTNDYDGDGVVNLAEWGFVGDPVKPGIKGKSPYYLGLDGSGTNMVYVYPRRTDEPRPTYTVVAKEDLILSSDWVPVLPDPQVGVGLWNTNAPGNGIRTVTNLVPVDVNQKFINVRLSE